jgi:single-strand DNA-binding protein
MNGFNRVLVLGNVGNAPEVKTTKNGSSVVSFSMATKRQWKDKYTGETKQETTWIPCTAFGRTAEIIEKYVGKGAPLYAEGHWHNDQYEKNGEKRTYTKCVIDSIQLLPQGKRDESGQRSSVSGNSAPRYTAANEGQGNFEDFEEDFPLDFDALDKESGGKDDGIDIPF